jgi:hypothetical protein
MPYSPIDELPIEMDIQQATLLVSPFACAAEQESFSTEDIKRAIESFSDRA